VPIRLPSNAADEEAAAIVAAVEAHLRAEALAVAATASTGPRVDAWGFAGRLDGLGLSARRLPQSAPTGWAAAGRVERF
jgi:hypothetical protein